MGRWIDDICAQQMCGGDFPRYIIQLCRQVSLAVSSNLLLVLLLHKLYSILYSMLSSILYGRTEFFNVLSHQLSILEYILNARIMRCFRKIFWYETFPRKDTKPFCLIVFIIFHYSLSFFFVGFYYMLQNMYSTLLVQTELKWVDEYLVSLPAPLCSVLVLEMYSKWWYSLNFETEVEVFFAHACTEADIKGFF